VQTKLGIFCDKLIEAGWLAAVIVAPLFFNFYSHRSFEPDKVTLLRSIALVMAWAWIIRFIETRPSMSSLGVRHLTSSNPLAIPALIMAGVYILTTITSVVPRISFWGAYGRPQGAYTTFSYIVIFFLMGHSLRTRQQLERLIFVLLLTSLPVSLYGVMQHYGLNPLTWVTEGAARVRSTMGNPIFLAAYLIMVVPLTLWRLLDSFSALLHGERKGISTSLLTGCYALLLATQLLCILFTQSRGPVLGLMGGLFFFLVLLAISGNRRELNLAVIGVAVILMLFLILFNLPNSPLAPWRDVPYLGRFAHIVPEVYPGRMLIWQGAIEMATADPWRTLVGYGPDSMFVAYNKFYPAELVKYELGERPDRAHNQSFDALVTTGLIGLAGYILLFTSVFYYGLKGLGLIRNHRQRATFILLWLIGGGLGALSPRLLEGTWQLAGMGLSLGFVAALAVYLIVHALFFNDASRKTESSWRRRLLIALLSALVAHFIEIQSGIAVAATLTYFWVYAALLVIVGYSLQKEPLAQAVVAAPPAEASSRHRVKKREKQRRTVSRLTGGPWNSTILSYSLLMGLILTTMGFDFINYQFQLTARGFWVLGLIAVVWLLGGTIIVTQISERKAPSQSSRGVGSPFMTYGLISLGWFLTFIVFYTATIRPGADIGNTIVVYYLFLLLAMTAIAAVLMKDVATRLRFWRRTSGWFYLILSLAATALIFTTNLSAVRADIYFKVGLALREAELYDESIALYRRALALTPHQDRYYLFIGLDSMAKMEVAPDSDQRSYWFKESKEALEKAQEISPLDPDHPANLGTLYLRWAGTASDPVERARRLERALEYYQQAAIMSPHHHGFRLQSDLLQIHLLLGDLYTAMGQLDQAVAVYEKAREVDPNDYRGPRGLAAVYQRLGRFDEALSQAERARDLAPSEEKEQIDELIAQLKAQMP